MSDTEADRLEDNIRRWEPATPQWPAGVELLCSFRFGHLPGPLQDVSRPFAVHACDIVERLSGFINKGNLDRDHRRLYQVTVALQKLVESKDAAVRAVLP